jgi:hypothetical protein
MRFRSNSLTTRFKLAHTKGPGCWQWTGTTASNGYGIIRVKGKQQGAHRVSMMLYRSFDLESPLFVCHHCDNPGCVNPDHLFIGTALDNQRDRIRKGRSSSGERNGKAILTTDQVLLFRKLHQAGQSCADLSKRFGVHRQTMSKVLRRTRWKRI